MRPTQSLPSEGLGPLGRLFDSKLPLPRNFLKILVQHIDQGRPLDNTAARSISAVIGTIDDAASFLLTATQAMRDILTLVAGSSGMNPQVHNWAVGIAGKLFELLQVRHNPNGGLNNVDVTWSHVTPEQQEFLRDPVTPTVSLRNFILASQAHLSALHRIEIREFIEKAPERTQRRLYIVTADAAAELLQFRANRRSPVSQHNNPLLALLAYGLSGAGAPIPRDW